MLGILGNEFCVPHILTGRRPLYLSIILNFLEMRHVKCTEEGENKLMG
jgi:hypothetical protein